MSSEIPTLLDRATPEVVQEVDYQQFAQRGRRRRRTKQAAGAVAGTAAVVGAAAGIVLAQPPPSPEVMATPDGLGGDCFILDVEILTDRLVDGDTVGALDHLRPGDRAAPTSDELYVNGRPTTSGPHFDDPAPVSDSVAAAQLDERAVTHNLEHGAVAIWFDPEQVDAADIEQMQATVAELHAAGFARPDVGAGVFASPFTDPGIDSGAAIALRAWGTGLDCGAWDADVARQFVTEHYGSRGLAPEGQLAGHPAD